MFCMGLIPATRITLLCDYYPPTEFHYYIIAFSWIIYATKFSVECIEKTSEYLFCLLCLFSNFAIFLRLFALLVYFFFCFWKYAARASGLYVENYNMRGLSVIRSFWPFRTQWRYANMANSREEGSSPVWQPLLLVLSRTL